MTTTEPKVEPVCKLREGKIKCPWWITGCLNPEAPPSTKRACTEGKLERRTN